jgi:hypothetical protein
MFRRILLSTPQRAVPAVTVVQRSTFHTTTVQAMFCVTPCLRNTVSPLGTVNPKLSTTSDGGISRGLDNEKLWQESGNVGNVTMGAEAGPMDLSAQGAATQGLHTASNKKEGSDEPKDPHVGRSKDQPKPAKGSYQAGNESLAKKFSPAHETKEPGLVDDLPDSHPAGGHTGAVGPMSDNRNSGLSEGFENGRQNIWASTEGVIKSPRAAEGDELPDLAAEKSRLEESKKQSLRKEPPMQSGPHDKKAKGEEDKHHDNKKHAKH